MKVYEILPGKLYQSRTTVGLSAAEVNNALSINKIDIIINLWHTADDRSWNIHRYVCNPMPDGKYPDIDEYTALAYKALDYINHGHVVLTHCHAGVNRSGLLNAIIVMMLTGVDGTAAMKLIKEKRPGALNNEHFCMLLDDLYIELEDK